MKERSSSGSGSSSAHARRRRSPRPADVCRPRRFGPVTRALPGGREQLGLGWEPRLVTLSRGRRIRVVGQVCRRCQRLSPAVVAQTATLRHIDMPGRMTTGRLLSLATASGTALIEAGSSTVSIAASSLVSGPSKLPAPQDAGDLPEEGCPTATDGMRSSTNRGVVATGQLEQVCAYLVARPGRGRHPRDGRLFSEPKKGP